MCVITLKWIKMARVFYTFYTYFKRYVINMLKSVSQTYILEYKNFNIFA